MVKQIQKLKQAVSKLFEEGLLALVALLVIALEIFFVQAQTSDQTNLSFTICPAGGGITVTNPNGGERWLINSTQSITWTTCDPDGAIVNVKIELQRSTGGSWETLVASTANDGSHDWQVTEPTTTTALIRISDVSNPTSNDTSDRVFEIYKSGGGPPPCATPVIDSVTPQEFINIEEITLVIIGYFAYGDEQVYLNEELLDSTFISSERIEAIVPAGFPVGEYILLVRNSCGNSSEYWPEIVVNEEECHNPVIEEVSPTTFSNATEVTLTIKGQFEYEDEEVFLDEEGLGYDIISETEIEAYVSEGFPPGSYTLSITNGCGGYAEYGVKIVIYEEEEEEEEEIIEEPLEPIIDIIIQPILDLFKPVIRPPSTGGVIKPPKVFTPDSRFYTDKFEQNWICYLIWLIILLIFARMMQEYFTEEDDSKKKNR